MELMGNRRLIVVGTLLVALGGCAPDTAPRAKEAPAPASAAQEDSLGSRVRAVGPKTEQALQESAQRTRDAVDAAQ